MTSRNLPILLLVCAGAAASCMFSPGCGTSDRTDKGNANTAWLKHSEGYIREAAAAALGNAGAARAVEPLIAALDDTTWAVRKKAAESLGKLGDARAVGPLVRGMKEGNAELRATALEALIKLGKPSVEPLIGCLKYDDPFVRERAAQALGNLRDVRAVPALNDSLKDPDADVRAAAAAALESLRKP